MTQIEEVADQTFRIEVLLPGIKSIFAVYFIRDGEGVLIEPGPGAAIPSIQGAMKQLGMRNLAYIIPTHIHMDHAGAIGELAGLFPVAEVILHPRAARHAVDPSRLIEGTKMAFGDRFEDLYGPIRPVPQSQAKTPEDGETLSVGGRGLQIIHSPGHAPHHLSIFDKKNMGLFSGEALGFPHPGNDSFILPAAAPPSFDMELYLETMDKLKQLDPLLLFYSHAGAGKNPAELISRAAENTRVFGDIILNNLRRGETDERIATKIRDHVSGHLGPGVEVIDDEMTVRGYIDYFKRKYDI